MFDLEIPMQAFRGSAPKFILAGLAALMILGTASPVLQNIALHILP